MQERLQKILAQAGVASRRNAEKLILAGRVNVNGTCVRELGAKFDTSYTLNKICKREVGTPFTIKVNGDTLFEGRYKKKYVRDNLYSFTVEKE